MLAIFIIVTTAWVWAIYPYNIAPLCIYNYFVPYTRPLGLVAVPTGTEPSNITVNPMLSPATVSTLSRDFIFATCNV